MDVLPASLTHSPRQRALHRSPRRVSGSPRRSTRLSRPCSPRQPCSPTALDSYRLTVGLGSPEAPLLHRILFQDSPTDEMTRVQPARRSLQSPDSLLIDGQMSQTAPVGDRRSKRFDLSNWQRDLDNIAAPMMAKGSLFPAIAQLEPASDPYPSTVKHTRTFSLSRIRLDEDEDEDSPFRVPSSSARRANSLKHHRVSPEVSLVPTSASHGALSAVSPNVPAPRLSSSTSGAALEALNETDAQSSFAPREPVLEQSIFSPATSTSSASGPTRSRAGSVSRIPVSTRSSVDSLARARKATSMMDLARHADLNPLASSRKRNANGALVGGGGARSRLAALSPLAPPSSSGPMPSSSPSAHAMRDTAMVESDDEEESAIPRSRSQALPLHMRLSEPIPLSHHRGTPAACKIARPLQSAFKSTGLLSKRIRASDPGLGGGSPARGLPLFALRTELKAMPDTPCKRPSLLEVATAGAVDAASPLSPQSGIPRPLLRTVSSSSSGSTMSETSPTAVKAAALTGKRTFPLSRRLSTESFKEEPQTPTRITTDSPLSTATPTSRVSPDGKNWPPAPTIVTAAPQPSVTPLTPFNPRASHPPPASRPNFRSRHSNSALLTLRQRELAHADRFESQFVVVRDLGKGESSEAFAVRDRQSGSVWAVKRTKLAYGGPKDRTRRLEEVDALRSLSGGPHIVAMADAWEQSGHLFIQTELCDGGTLAYFLDVYGQQHERLPESCVWKILAEVSEGLAHIHSRGFLHLDLKPANIFLTAAGNCRIGDFGMATRWPRQSALEVIRNAGLESPGWDSSVRDAALELAPQPTALERRYRMRSAPEAASLKGLELEREGDREYIAPEVLGGLYGREADVFSLGLIALEAATNVVLPDNGEPWRKLRDGDLSDVELSPLSSHLVSLLLNLLHPLPEARLTASQLADHPLLGMTRHLAGSHSAILEEEPDFLESLLGTSNDADAMDVDN